MNFGAVLGHALFAPLFIYLEAIVLTSLLVKGGPPLSVVMQHIKSKDNRWYFWTGGCLGALYQFVSTMVTPRIGLSLFFICLVLGQLFSSVVMDHWGLFHFPVSRIQYSKALGIVLLLASAVMAQNFSGTAVSTDSPGT